MSDDEQARGNVTINIKSANLHDGAKLVEIKHAELERVRRTFLQHLTRSIVRRSIPLGLPDIKGSDPRRSRGEFELENLYVAPETDVSLSLTREELFLEPSESGITSTVRQILTNRIGSRFADEEAEIFNLFAIDAVETLRSTARSTAYFDDNAKPLFQMNLQIDDVVKHVPHLVILGSPGSGKTTFINYTTYSLALRLLDPKRPYPKSARSFQNQPLLLPIPISLRDYSYRLADEFGDSPTRLVQFAAEQYQVSGIDTKDLQQIFQDALYAGEAVMFLDGLDEVPPRFRSRVKEDIEALRSTFESRIIVACRTLSYQDPRWQLSPTCFGVVTLAPFDLARIDTFLAAFYREVARKKYSTIKPVDVLQNDIIKAVRHPSLFRLATNPLLLTIIALVHLTRGDLTSARAILYEEAVEWLLSRWSEKSHRKDEESIREMLENDDVVSSFSELEEVLRRIAFEVHALTPEGSDSRAYITDTMLVEYLRMLHPAATQAKSKIWAMRLVEAIKEYSGLLVPASVINNQDVYTFPHRTFQEYLAARHIVSQENFSDYINIYGRKGSLWREVILLATGYKAQKDGVDAPITAAGKLCPVQDPVDEDDWKAAVLAGEIFLESGLNRVYKNGRDIELFRTRTRLSELVMQGKLSALERHFAANVLSSLIDARTGVELRADGRPDIMWIRLPDGGFKVEEHETNLLAGNYIPAFEISKYLITNAHYSAFVTAGAGRAPLYWEGNEPPRHLRNHPVVHVSWFDAMNFCDWLSEICGQRIRLPLSKEWIKSARGINDTRPWPWGNEPDNTRANVGLTGIGGTCAVGLFPLGLDDPWHYIGGGPCDMSGNVNEWCMDFFVGDQSDRQDVETPRKILGGSFKGGLDASRCIPRTTWRIPRNFHSDVGFRIVRVKD